MPYKHYGEMGDIWKHLPLCEVIRIECPEIYIETNSAYAQYSLDKTEEQQYGIYHLLEKAYAFPALEDSAYFKLIRPYVMEGKYMGSPGLAIALLKNIADKYIFFDIEKDALENLKSFATQSNVDEKVQVFNQDSVGGLMDMLPTLPSSTLIHIDPYTIYEPNAEGKTFLDLFIKASQHGLKCFLWYGFETLNDKDYLNDLVIKRLSQSSISSAYCCEMMMEGIQRDSVLCNPGVVGCGVLSSNLSAKSNAIISEFADLLVALYKGSKYKECKGDLVKDVVVNM